MGGREDQGYKVYVGNCEGVPEEELRDEFSKYGGVENVWIARNPPGFAFVWYRDERDAQGACAAMDGKSLAGKNLRVEMVRALSHAKFHPSNI
jgi:RNA recognition motif-containing protein